MIIGFTGTRTGITNSQTRQIIDLLDDKTLNITKLFKYEDKPTNIVNQISKFYISNCKGSFLDRIIYRDSLPIAHEIYELLEDLDKDKYEVKYQIVDSRNKTKFLVTENNTLVPVRPSGSIYNVQIVKSIDKYINSFKQTYDNLIEIPIDRYNVLLKKSSESQIKLVSLAYMTLLPKSQQLSITLDEYKKYLDEYGSFIEGFASPFNSQAVMLNQKFCSIFPELDRPYGSICNFFDLDVQGETIIINPPFVEDILLEAAKKCIKLSEKNKVIFRGPNWKDAEFYLLLEERVNPFKFICLRQDVR